MKTRSMDIKKRKIVNAVAVMALAAVWISVPFLSSAASEAVVVSGITRTTLLASPAGGPNPNGFASWELDSNGRREIEIDVYSLSHPTGTSLSAYVDGGFIGTLSVQFDAHAHLRLRTQDGQQVPNTNEGSSVEVRFGQEVVVIGNLITGGPSPSPSVSPTGSPSPSPTGSPSPSPTASPSPTGSPNPSPTASPSPTGSPSPSPTGTPTGSPSPSPTVTPSGSPSPTPSGTPGGGDLFAGLSGGMINGVLPTGYAQYELHSSRTELEVRVNQVNLPIGTALSVVVNSNSVGNLFIESGGEGRLRLRSDHGDNVPVVVFGSSIALRNGGNTVLSGMFSGFSGPTPSPSASPTPSPGGTPGPSPSPSPSLGRSFEANLTGSQMSPPVGTSATGEFKVTLNAAETQATVFGEFHNLSSSQTAARIETTVGSVFTIHDFGAIGGTNGNFASVTFDVSAAQVQLLRSGLWAAVIASSNNPGGEIRANFRQRSRSSDFDGNGLHDFAVFRPSNGAWYTQNSTGFNALTFGSPNDKVVSGDYDGDGKTDVAVFRNASGQGVWDVRSSYDGSVRTTAWGLPTDIPVRGDFDGDGRLDLAVYRPSDGVWYINKSDNSGYSFVRFGAAEDKPIPADMDGDGKDDIVVFRPSEGNWYWLRSSDGQFNVAHFGATGDIPIRGDFDGDGKADLTVFRPSTGVWYSYRSSNQTYLIVKWGLDGDIPAAGNYDGDGKTDLVVFRPSDGNWYLLYSSDNSFEVFHFGLAGDIPAISQ